MSHPRVGVVVVDYDGGDLTMHCLRSLVRTDWPDERFEIVLVDNASTTPVVERVRSEMPGVGVVESPRNVGFAGGVDLGLDALPDVDYVALVNNDVTVPPGWLTPLVETLVRDPGLGAACPKILFSDRFVEVTLQAPATTKMRGDSRALGVRVSAVEIEHLDVTARCQYVDGFWGVEHGDADEPAYQWTGEAAVLWVPFAEGTREARIRLAADAPKRVTIGTGAATPSEVDVGPVPAWHTVSLPDEPFDIVNNLGSDLVADGYGADRAYRERDDASHESAEDVFAWCGAAVLLSGEYLDDVGYLDRRLFLYYEDFEHSWRGRRRGWRYRTVPRSVVRHVHSATSVEGSPLSHFYNERNHLLVLVRHGSFGLIARAFVRYLLVTLSYARRDLVSKWLRRERASSTQVRRRMRALGGALRLTPSMLAARLGDGRRRKRRLPAPDAS